MTDIALVKPEDCKDCLAVTLTQRNCPECSAPTVEAKNGEGRFWVCSKCGEEWDGGEHYGFACPNHGGTGPAKAQRSAQIDGGKTNYSQKRFQSGACAYMPKF